MVPHRPLSCSRRRTGKSLARSKTMSGVAQSRPRIRIFVFRIDIDASLSPRPGLLVERALEAHDDLGHFGPHHLHRGNLAPEKHIPDLGAAELDLVAGRVGADLLVDHGAALLAGEE